MNKKDLKTLIKPLVKECIHEVLLEEGLLSNVVAEVAKGMQSAVIVETPQPETRRAPPQEDMSRKIHEQKMQHRKKLMDAIGGDAYNGVNLFEGTDPISPYEAKEATPGSVDLGNPRDAGVDISSLMGGASKMWKALK